MRSSLLSTKLDKCAVLLLDKSVAHYKHLDSLLILHLQLKSDLLSASKQVSYESNMSKTTGLKKKCLR